jgi:hypothetical protein
MQKLTPYRDPMIDIINSIVYIDTMRPIEIISQFDKFLEKQGLELEAVVVGGSALALLGIITRETRDCDVLYPELPEKIKSAAQEFAKNLTREGIPLDENWLNNGPSSLMDDLPKDWMMRIEPIFAGNAILLKSLGRTDLLRSKLFALCDRGLDLPDCLALAPTQGEIAEILPWLKQRDANHGWPDHVEATLSYLKRRLSDGI